MTRDNYMIAMSGGVDSAVAAHLVAKAHPRAAGVTMNITSPKVGCPEKAAADIAGAAAVCAALGIPHFVAELGDIFQREVVDPFVAAYENGLTPNPCVLCNRAVKFGALLEFARKQGYDALATGHYARVERSPAGRALLRRATDPTKDQTYMLYALSQDVLCCVAFPLGELTKREAREIAAELQFPMAHQKDSQDICFVPDGDYAAVIERLTGKTPAVGNFLSQTGEVLGQHKGQLHYTIGQRKGLGISLGKPAFVTAKSAPDNTVILGEERDLYTTRLVAHNINLIPYDTIKGSVRLLAKTRYRQLASPARVEQLDADTLLVEFEAPQRAISAGQSLVLYEDDYVVGGGIIA